MGSFTRALPAHAKRNSPCFQPLTSQNDVEGQIIRLGSSTSALRTFELRRDPLSEQWLLESITDN
ncbi:hypothetical protein [Pseudarthrobacter oxydans]|uniref:hypothetical protein n=1 Tax=Pseudarthrobacter oxydans TaxID=1671 RepID=UPI0037F4F3C1